MSKRWDSHGVGGGGEDGGGWRDHEQGCRVQFGTEAGAAVVQNNPHKTWTWPQTAPGHRLDSKEHSTNKHSLSLDPSKCSHFS